MPMMMTGVPKGVAQDGWWLEDAPPVTRQLRVRGPVWVLAALVVLADALFWRQAGPGLSLVVFMAAVALTATRPRRGWPPFALALALLPMVERVQALSLGFAVLGLLAYVIGQTQPDHLLATMARFAKRAPAVALRDAWHGLAQARATVGEQGRIPRLLRSVALPLGLGLIFAALLVQANPLMQHWLNGWHFAPNPFEWAVRAMFWAGIALVVWPLLVVGMRAAQMLAPAAQRQGPSRPRRSMGLVTAASVTSSLVLFNLMFALQTLTDAAIFLGGANLPAGMSHAEYAHRGAYPLVVTALLAGGFALMSRPFAREARILQVLLVLWVAQNVALVISALYRLDLYVDSYGLTYLRAHAAVWMVLVALGLGLILWQIVRGLPNGWLVRWSAGLGLGVLYVCCFVNFAGVIAEYNLIAAQEGRLEQGFDAGYLCALGSDAWAARARAQGAGYTLTCPTIDDGWDSFVVDLTPPQIEGWRDWSYRSWRVLRAGQAAMKGVPGAYLGRG